MNTSEASGNSPPNRMYLQPNAAPNSGSRFVFPRYFFAHVKAAINLPDIHPNMIDAYYLGQAMEYW